MKYLKLITLLLMVGCTEAPSPEVNFDKYISDVVIEEDKTLPTLGRQQTVGGVCFIKLQQYPVCLQHEMRHCIEGDWHQGYESDDDCFEDK